MSKGLLLTIVFAVVAVVLLALLASGPGPEPVDIKAPAQDAPPPGNFSLNSDLPLDAGNFDVTPPKPLPPAAAAPSAQAIPKDKDALMDSMYEAAHTFSPEALPFLAEQLESSDPEVRELALESIKVLSEPAGIPILRQAAAKARSAKEKKDLLEAAEWLALPDWVPPETGGR